MINTCKLKGLIASNNMSQRQLAHILGMTVPLHFRDFIIELINKDILRGQGAPRDENGFPTDLNLTEDLIRSIVVGYRVIEAKIQVPDIGC